MSHNHLDSSSLTTSETLEVSMAPPWRKPLLRSTAPVSCAGKRHIRKIARRVVVLQQQQQQQKKNDKDTEQKNKKKKKREQKKMTTKDKETIKENVQHVFRNFLTPKSSLKNILEVWSQTISKLWKCSVFVLLQWNSTYTCPAKGSNSCTAGRKKRHRPAANEVLPASVTRVRSPRSDGKKER